MSEYASDDFRAKSLECKSVHLTVWAGWYTGLYRMPVNPKRQSFYFYLLMKYKSDITIEQVYTYTNMMCAFDICLDIVHWKKSVQSAESRALEVIGNDLHCILHEGKLPWLNPRNPIYIRERGKTRKITPIAFNSRVLQRCYCDFGLLPVFAPTLISTNGASMEDKGVAYTRKYCKKYLIEMFNLYGLDFYILKTDYKAFFDSIPHKECRLLLESAFEDQRMADFGMEFLTCAARHAAACMPEGAEKQKQLEILERGEGIGIPLGSQVSQCMAVFVPSSVDHYIKDRMGIRHYIRYMDDIIVFAHTKEELMDILSAIRTASAKIGLTLNEEKTSIIPAKNGFTFLKFRYRITETGRILCKPARTTITRSRRKLKRYHGLHGKGQMSLHDVCASMEAWKGHAAMGQNRQIFKNLLHQFKNLFGVSYFNAKSSEVKHAILHNFTKRPLCGCGFLCRLLPYEPQSDHDPAVYP